MKKVMLAVAMAAVLAAGSGCASMLVAQGSRRQAEARRAIRAHEIPGGAAVGIDLLSLDTLTERPLLQLGAAVLDAATIYAAYEGLQSLRDRGESAPAAAPSVAVTGTGKTGIVQQVRAGDAGARGGDALAAPEE